MEHIMNQLQPGQTIEITNAYVGMYQKLPTRVIIHRLTEEQTQKRWRDQAISWQIEALFKTWKSFFQIDKCKRMKQERLECHLYGQLIGILLCSSTMFRMRQLLLNKKKRELSEYKAVYMTKDYFLLLYQSLQKTPRNYQRSSFVCFTC
jgi:transposase